MKLLTGKWSFYINGSLLALLILFCLYLFNDAVGMSDGMIVLSEYFKNVVETQAIREPPPLDWQTGFLLGIFIGGLSAAIVSSDWKIRIFQEEGSGIIVKTAKTIICGISGGFLVMLGLQLSGDSFLGQWAAAIQLSGGAWVFIISCFVVASGVAIALERRSESANGEQS